jgi:hypothetical protein
MRVAQLFVSGICVTVGLTCYLLFLAERDGKMMNYYDSTIQRQAQ